MYVLWTLSRSGGIGNCTFQVYLYRMSWITILIKCINFQHLFFHKHLLQLHILWAYITPAADISQKLWVCHDTSSWTSTYASPYSPVTSSFTLTSDTGRICITILEALVANGFALASLAQSRCWAREIATTDVHIIVPFCSICTRMYTRLRIREL